MLFYAPGKLLWIISRESDGRGIWNAKKEKNNHSNVFELYQGDQLWVGRGIWNVKEKNTDL